MQVGIFARTFAETGAVPVLNAVRNAGYEVAQFNIACVGPEPMPRVISPTLAGEIATASLATGVAIAAVSGTYNMIHPDHAKRADGLARLAVLIRAAPQMGVRLITLCTGTRDAADQWKYHPDNPSKEAWRELIVEMAKAAELAEEFNVDLGIEPELANVVSSAEHASLLLKELKSPRIRVVLDPANLFEVALPDDRRLIVERAVDRVGEHMVMAHAKDRDAAGEFVAAGSGVIDFPHFIKRLRSVGFHGPLVTHGLSAEEAPKVAAFLRQILSSN